jgi:beta propeller repeat protein
MKLIKFQRLIRLMLCLSCISIFISGCAGKQAIVQSVPSSTPELNKIEERVYSGYEAALDTDRMVYRSEHGLKVIDLNSNQEIADIPITSTILGFDIFGESVVWSDLRNEQQNISDLGSEDKANADIFIYNIATKQEKQITNQISAQVQPKIWEHYIVWMDNQEDKVKAYPSDWQIILYDLESNVSKAITNTSGANTLPDISDDKIVWEDGRNVSNRGFRAGENLPKNNTDIYLYDISTKETKPIATGPLKEGRPHISGNRVVWDDYNNAKATYNADVYTYDLMTNKSERLTKQNVDQSGSVIYGDYVAWTDERRGTSTNDVIENGKKPNSDIYLFDLIHNTERLMTGDEPQLQPLLSDHWLIYITSRQVNPEIHALRYR